MIDQRYQDLASFFSSAGLEPPMPIETIIALEDQGHVVDLVTGEVDFDAADAYRFTLTVVGEATLHLRTQEAGRPE